MADFHSVDSNQFPVRAEPRGEASCRPHCLRGCNPGDVRLKNPLGLAAAVFSPPVEECKHDTIVALKFLRAFSGSREIVSLHVADWDGRTSPLPRTSEWRVDSFDPHLLLALQTS